MPSPGKLLFICGSLEPGRDGVGDYTRRLGDALDRQGHETRLVALNDPWINPASHVPGAEEGRILRLSAQTTWRKRRQSLASFMKAAPPHWVSLQYVPYAYHPKGLPHQLLPLARLRKIHPTISWQIMLHEIWTGNNLHDRFRDRLYGFPQKKLLTRLWNSLDFHLCHTNTVAYQAFLAEDAGIPARRLPLFGNIPPIDDEGVRQAVKSDLAERLDTPLSFQKTLLIPVFGVAKPNWPFEPFLESLRPLLMERNLRAVIVFVGRDQEQLASRFPPQTKESPDQPIRILYLGFQSPEYLSALFQIASFGLSTVSLAMAQKSGAVAAFREHGRNVLLLRDDVRLRHPAPAHSNEPGVFSLADLSRNFDQLIRPGPRKPGVDQIATRFIADLLDLEQESHKDKTAHDPGP